MGRYADALRWLGSQEWFLQVFKPIFPRLDRWMYRRSGGRLTAATNFGLRNYPAGPRTCSTTPSPRCRSATWRDRVRARAADSEVVARAWPRLVAFWPAFNRYKERSGREIRVFVLDPC